MVKTNFTALLFMGLCAACSADIHDMAPVSPIRQTRFTGIDLSMIDRHVRPQDDFYQYANGVWLQSAIIPPDKNSVGVWQEVNGGIQLQLRKIAKDLSAGGGAPGSTAQKTGDFYASYLDEARIEKLGVAPLTEDMARISAINSHDEISREMMRLARGGVATPIKFAVLVDPEDAGRHIFVLAQSGLGLPGRDYYLGDSAALREIRESAYPAYIERLFIAAGVERAGEKAQEIIALEGRLAAAQWSRAHSRDPEKVNTRYFTDLLEDTLPGVNWGALLDEAGISARREIIIRQPGYFRSLSRMMADIPLETWRAYLLYRLIDARAPFLPDAFVRAHFDFHRGALQGRKEPPPRWERGVALLNELIGAGLSQIWVERHFPSQTKKQLEEYLAVFIQAFREGVEDLDWMSAATKTQAHAKLDKLRIKIGYPDEQPDYGALTINREDLIGNIGRAHEFLARQDLERLQKRPADIEDWAFPPQTVVSYAIKSRNEIYFLAGNLTPPYFMPDADPAANYGALSALIGHEVSHLFDDSGRRYDGDGTLNDWWTEGDAAAFQERAQRLVAQYDGYGPEEDMSVDGEQTLGENIADLSGLSVAYRAYQIALDGAPAPVIDGMTGDQRFFIARAQTYRVKMTQQRMRQWLETRPHAPAQYRINGAHRNMQAFHDAFDVKPGDGMYLPPEQRVRIW